MSLSQRIHLICAISKYFCFTGRDHFKIVKLHKVCGAIHFLNNSKSCKGGVRVICDLRLKIDQTALKIKRHLHPDVLDDA